MARDSFDESKSTKKKVTKKKTEVTKPQSSSVTKSKTTTTKADKVASKSTFLGGGAPVQKVEKAVSKPTTTSKSKTVTQEERINQKSYGTTKPNVTTKTQRTKRDTKPVTSSQRKANAEANMNLKQRNIRDTAPVQSRREIAQAMKSGDYDRASQLRGEAKPGSRRARYEQLDRNISNRVTNAIKNPAPNDRDLNLKQTAAEASRRRAKTALNKVDDAARNLTDRANRWERENLSARNPMLETQRTVKNQKVGEHAAERFQERFERQELSEKQKAFSDYTSGVIQRKALGYAKTASDLLKTNEGYKAQGRWAQEDPEFARKISSHEFAQRADKAFNDYSVKQEEVQKRLNKIENNASGAGKIALQAYGSGIEMGVDRLAGPLWAASMFASAYGNQRGQALKEGASDEQDARAAFLGAGVEVATEYMFKPVAGIASKFGGKHSLDFAGKLAAKVTGKLTGNKARIADIAIRTLGSQVEEGLEEVAGWAVNPYIQNAAYKNDLQKQKTEEAHADYEDMQRSFWNQFDTEEEAQQAALYVNSDEFIDDQVKTYKESGATDEEARSMARILQKYFLAHFDNDEEAAEEAEAEMDRFVVGDVREKHDWKELGQTLASTFLLTGVTGGASTYYTNQIGNQMLQGEVGKDRVKQYTDIVIKYDPDNAKDAKYVKDTIDNGGTPTGTQVYQVASQATEVLQDMGKREMASNQVKQRRMREEDLRVPPVAMTARGPQFNEETAKAYQASYDKALGVVRGVRKHGTDVGLSEEALTSPETMRTAAHAVAAYETGTITAEQINDLTIDNPEIRTIFELATGVDLAQYNVMKRGKIDEIASNNAMMNGLLANAADNYVQMARAEQKQWSNRTRGRMLNAMSNSFGEKGNLAMHDVLKAVDPRDQQKYLLTARIAQNVYDYARRTDISWDKMKNAYKGSFRNVDIDVMKDVYDAAKMDKDKAETAYLGRQVVAGEAMRFEKSDNGVARVTGEFTNDSARELTGEEDEAMRAVADRLGVNIRIVPDSEMTIDGRMSAGENAENVPRFNGSYDSGTNTILLAETNGLNDNILYAMSHETTHLLKQYAPDAYMKLSNYVMDKFYKSAPGRYETAIKSKQDLYKRAVNQDLSEESALEEIIADATRDFWSDPEFVNQISNDIEDPGFFKSIVNAIRDMLRHIRNLLSSGHFDGTEHEDVLWDMLGTYSKAERLWLDAYRQAARNRAQMAIDELHNEVIEESRTTGTVQFDTADIDDLDMTNKTVEDNNGNSVAQFQDNGSVSFSISSYENEGRKIYKDYLDKLVNDKELSQEEANQMLKELETIYNISKRFADSGRFEPYTAWSYADVVRDAKGRPVFSSIRKNSEYKMNIDFSTICKKRRTLDAVFREMIRRGMFEKLDLNKDESAAMVVNINNLIRKNQFEAACALCFVEARRYRQQQTAKTFTNMWNELVESMYSDKDKIAYFNFGRDEQVQDVPDGIHTMDDSQLDLSHVKAVAEELNDKGKPKQTAEAKAARLILNNPEQRKLMRVGDMMASTGFENMQVENPELMKVYNSKKGTGGAKSSFGDVQYLNEIINSKTFDRQKAYDVSGVRIQSFSDYVPRMVFDYVQVIADLAAKKLPAHAYTKEVLFVLQFGLTGAKVNMSLVPDVVADGIAPGLDKDGNYAWNEEGTFPWEDFTDDKGRKWPGARSIQKASGYKENCGTIAVGISDKQIMKMLADPEIQMVIPYHKSSLNPIVAAMTNVDRFTNYEDFQNTKNAEGKTVKTDFAWDKKLFGLTHYTRGEKKGELKPKEKWGNVQDLVKEYVDWCESKNYTPKFSQFLYLKENNDPDGDFVLDENGNKIINPGYYKMLEDFALMDNDGNFKPQGDVRMQFPTAETGIDGMSMESLIERGLTDDTELEAMRSEKIGGIVDEIDNMFNEGTLTEQSVASQKLAQKFSITPEMDSDYMNVVNSGDMRKAQSLVEDAAIASMPNIAKNPKYKTGRVPLKLYHGTRFFGFTEFKDSKHEVPFFYTSTDRTVSAHYAGDEHYAGVREIGKPYREGNSAEDVIENAKYVLGADMKLMSKEDKVARFNQVKEDVIAAADKIDKYAEAWRNSEEKYELDDYISNAIAWVEMPFWDVRDGDLQYDFDSDTEENKEWRENLEHDLEMYDQYREVVKDFYGDNYNSLPKDLKLYLSYLIGYEVGDAAIDIRYGMLRSATSEDILSNMNGENIIAPSDLKTRMDSIKDIGAYEMYGDLGENPFEFDAEGAQWYALQVPEVDPDHYVSTDNVCKWAYENGYTSVIMHNIRDYGDKADNYVFFNSSQLKSADPVTYDDNGDVIPLSERFDPANNDIRYSLPTQDSDGKILTDGQMEYFKNSQARDIFGRLVPVYHVTPIGGFTVFDPSYSFDETSISFSNSLDFALNYSSDDGNPEDWETAAETRLGDVETEDDQIGHYKVYLKMDNPLVLEGDYLDEMDIYEWPVYAKANGYDGVIYRDFDDGADIYQVFSSNQIKDTRNENPTAENPDIRYSIPDEDMVKKYIEQNVDDIHDIPLVDFMLEQNRQNLIAAEEAFQANVSERWNRKSESYIAALDDPQAKASLRSIMREVRKNSGTKKQYKSETLEDVLKDVKQMHKYARASNAEMFAKTAWEAAEKIIDDIDYNDDLYEKYVGVKKYLDKARIVVPEEYFYMQDFAEFARSIQGFVRFYADGISLEKAYGQLAKKYPDLFPSDVNNAVDMLMQIADVIDYTIPYRETYSSEEYSNLVEEVASNLCELVENGKDYKTTIEKLKVDAMNQRHQEALRKAEARHQEQLDESNARTEAQRQRAEKWKQRYNDRVQKGIKDRKERSEKEDHRKYFTRIQKNYKKLCDWVLKPTKEKNVPEEFRKSLAEFLQTLDLQTENSKKLEAKTGHVGQKTLKLRELKDRLNALAKSKTTEDGDYISGGFEIDAYAAHLLDILSDKYDGKSVDELDALAIRDIDVVLKTIIKNIQRYKQVKTETKMAEISDVGGRGVEFLKAKIDRDGPYSKRKGVPGALQTINATALTPPYLFERLGPIKEMYDALRHNGFDTYIRNEKMIIDRLAGILGKYNKTNRKGQNMPGSIVEEWRDERSAQTIQLTYGSVTMSVAQMMSLYCLSKRGEQALGHMLVGGIKTTPIQTTSKIAAEEKEKMSKAARLAKRTKNAAGNYVKSRFKGETETAEKLVLTYDDVQTIISKLTPDQKDVADKLQNLMSVDMARLGNEAHRELYGYEMFDEDFYFPIKVDSNQRETDINTIGEVFEKIKSFGFAKPLTPNANKAIIIDDIFSIVADHCNGMNLYNSYLVPITDFMKVLNYTHTFEDGTTLSMKDAIEQAYGSDMLKYVLNLMKDINGIKAENRGGLEGLMNKAIGRAKKTAVFGNVRVALQQPTAIVRAAAEINPKYLKGVSLPQTVASYAPFLRVTTKSMEEMWKYCPIAQWKAWGYYDTYMGKDIEDVMMNNWSIGDDILSGYYGQLDNATWAVIWQAVKAEQADKYPDMDHNSEEFLQICGRRASEVFDKTQVVDSTFHRSDAMRNKQVAVKIFTAFMAEPTLTLNVMRAGLFNASEEKKAGNKSKAAKILLKTLGIYIAQGVLVSAAQAVADAWRGKDPGLPWGDDDDDEEKAGYWLRWYHNFIYNCFGQGRFWENMYLVKDVTPYINYMISKGADYWNWDPTVRAVMGWDQDYLYSQNNLVFSALENTANGVAQSFKKLEKGDEYIDYNTKEPKRWYDINQKVASGIGSLLGIPAGTLLRDFKPIWDKLTPAVFAADTELMDAIANKMGYKPIEGSSRNTSSDNTDKTSVSTDDEEVETNVPTRESLPDNLTDEQKDEIIKSAEKRSKKAESEEEQGQLDYDTMLYNALKAASGLEGEEYNKKVYSSVANGLKGYIADGDYVSIGMMRTVIEEAGGDVEYFDKRVLEETKSAYKKALSYDLSYDERWDQKAMYRYMMAHGMTQEELSNDVLYSSELAKDMKVAYRFGDNNMIYEAMLPLVDAGITRTDLERLYENRNKMNLESYKKTGRYKDRLKSTGTFIWPVNGTVTSKFGPRGYVGPGASRNHPAIDIGCPDGTPVSAADGGVVIYVGWNGGYGNSVGIKHDNGMVTYYNHLSGFNVKEGDTVAQGQTIAASGNTGTSYGGHLDFKVLDKNGKAVDPEKYLDTSTAKYDLDA